MELREVFVPVGRVVATVSRRADQYVISFCMEYEVVKHPRQVNKPMSIGLDLGLTHTLTLSSGVKIASPRSLAGIQDAQRRVAATSSVSSGRSGVTMRPTEPFSLQLSLAILQPGAQSLNTGQHREDDESLGICLGTTIAK